MDRNNFRILMRIKTVYDLKSDSEGEEDDVDSQLLLIYHNSLSRTIMDFLIILFTLYSLIYTPMYFILNDYFTYLLFLEPIIDSIFFIKFVSNFFTCFYDIEENLIFDKRLIIQNYLQGWLITDLIATIPLNLIYFHT